uniref:ArsR family transcriptional regulator n=1 Tax=Geoglobus ahangari TaxID=113653 RepID=A0A7C3YMZ0_9EURY
MGFLTELGKSKKLRIIEKLRECSMSLKELADWNGLSVPTVSRNIRWLCDQGIVCRHENKYQLTGFGVAIEKLLRALMDIKEFKEEIRELPGFIELLPPEILAGMHLLRKCKVMSVEDALNVGISHIINSKQYGLYVDKIIDYNIYKIMVLKNLEGVSEKIISTRDTIFSRTSTIRRVLMDMDLSEDELDIVAEKVQIRIYDTPIQLGVIDGKIGIIQLNDRIDRIYVSNDKDFIRWCEYLFWFLWQRSEPFDIKKMIKEIKVQKGFS